jgi:molybdate transport system substrate-binding protein
MTDGQQMMSSTARKALFTLEQESIAGEQQAMPTLKHHVAGILAVLAALSGSIAGAGEATVAVAANFTDTVNDIASAFARETRHTTVLSFGSSGQLYAQITQEAPFEVFLSADQALPIKAVEKGHAVPDSRFTYAVGKLVLWSKSAIGTVNQETLTAGDFQRLAIANPETAPYGAAAVQVMKNLEVYDSLAPKLVQGNSISQTYQFVETGNAELGFVAWSQLAGKDEGARWIVPDSLYQPILQDAVLLQKGADNEAAQAFLAYLKSPTARRVITSYGYGVAD